VIAVQNDVADNPTKDFRSKAILSIIRQSGYSTQSISTDLTTSYLGSPAAAPQALADAWLSRSQYPAYCLDGVRVDVTPHTIAAAAPGELQAVWKLVAHGAGQVARYSHWQGLPGSTQWLGSVNYEWLIESTKIGWTDTGWQVDVGLVPTYLYAGGVPVSPDPRNNWAGLTQTHSTWADVTAKHPTWSDVVATPHPNTSEVA
jgi:hypothetical protein